MKDLLELLKYTLRSRQYFAQCGPDIAKRNLSCARIICIIGLIFQPLYLINTLIFFPEWAISPAYFWLVPVLGVILWHLHRLTTRRAMEYASKYLHYGTLSLYLLLMGYVIQMSVFPHPDVPSVFYPLFLLVAPVLFILPPVDHIVISAASFGIMAALVLHVKSPACYSHELFEDATALLFSVCVTMMMTQFRVQSDELTSKYYSLSRIDSLTGALNKPAAVHDLQAFLSRNDAGGPYAVLVVDIDHFAAVNTDYGHVEGDHLLAKLVPLLRSYCHSEDIIARIGGDVFLVVMKQLRRPGAGEDRARAILWAVGEMQDVSIPGLSCCVGLFSGPTEHAGIDASDAEAVIGYANDALNAAKRKGPCHFVSYNRMLYALEHPDEPDTSPSGPLAPPPGMQAKPRLTITPDRKPAPPRPLAARSGETAAASVGMPAPLSDLPDAENAAAAAGKAAVSGTGGAGAAHAASDAESAENAKKLHFQLLDWRKAQKAAAAEIASGKSGGQPGEHALNAGKAHPGQSIFAHADHKPAPAQKKPAAVQKAPATVGAATDEVQPAPAFHTPRRAEDKPWLIQKED